ncbi:LysR family transcriptional regulator [Endozoicomonadaceae bacterium StTr2]
MRYTLEQLRAFTLSVEKGSFSAAARELGKAQSAVSTAISNLELDLDLSLFDRSHREPTLTDAGQALFSHAQCLLDQAQIFEGRADAMSAGMEGQLSLAIEEAFMGQAMEELFVRFEQQFPQLELTIYNPTRSDVYDLVAARKVDIGLILTHFNLPSGFEIQPLREIKMIAVVSPNHVLATHNEVGFDMLQQQRQLVMTSRNQGPELNEQLSRRVWRLENQTSLISKVQHGLGWAWAPEHMVQPHLADGSLKQLQFRGNVSCIHRAADLIIRLGYKEGTAGQWIKREMATMPFFC